MKRAYMLAVLLLTAGVLLTGCSGTAEAAEVTELPVVKAGDGIIADGVVVPETYAALGFEAGGTVTGVLVEEGDDVEVGQVLARLDPADAQLAVQQAEAALGVAQARLVQVKAGARAEEVDAAAAQLAAADAAVAQAAAQLARLQSGVFDAEIAAAEAQVAVAAAERFGAVKDHDKTLECFERPDGKEICPLLGETEERARYALNAATESLEAAQAQLDGLRGEVSARQQAAQAALDAAEAQRDVAQARLDLTEAGASLDDIGVVEAEVAAAQAALARAEEALTDTELRAPFGGTVVVVDVRAGEQVVPGIPVVQLADLGNLQIETDDLTELDIASVREGAPVVVAIDGIPGLEMTGTVTRIRGFGETKQGDVTYTVTVRLDERDARLRWNMSATVTIEPHD
jgi:HlyD family secretion protein